MALTRSRLPSACSPVCRALCSPAAARPSAAARPTAAPWGRGLLRGSCGGGRTLAHASKRTKKRRTTPFGFGRATWSGIASRKNGFLAHSHCQNGPFSRFLGRKRDTNVAKLQNTIAPSYRVLIAMSPERRHSCRRRRSLVRLCRPHHPSPIQYTKLLGPVCREAAGTVKQHNSSIGGLNVHCTITKVTVPGGSDKSRRGYST